MLIFISWNAVSQIIPNAGFEDWTNYGAYTDPAGWSSINKYSGGTFPCERGMPGAVGSSFLKLTVKVLWGASPVSAIAFSSSSYSGDTAKPGFACNIRPLNLIGKWQYLVSGNDTTIVQVSFFKWNNITSISDIIGKGKVSITAGSINTWTNFNVPITFYNNSYPDSALIILGAAYGCAQSQYPVAGDYLYVDSLAFLGVIPAGIEEQQGETLLTISPNPFTSQTTISFSYEQKNTTIKIIDVLGKEIKNLELGMKNEKSVTIDMSGNAKGIYFLQVMDENKNMLNKKIVLQ